MSSSNKETASLLNLRHYPEFRRIYKHEIRDFDTGSLMRHLKCKNCGEISVVFMLFCTRGVFS